MFNLYQNKVLSFQGAASILRVFRVPDSTISFRGGAPMKLFLILITVVALGACNPYVAGVTAVRGTYSMSQEKFFDTGKVKINHLDYGSASVEPLVMLHGGAWLWQEYLSLIPSLSQRWRIYALDLRGNGRSGWVAEHYRLEDFSEDTVEFLRQLNARAVLVGHSMAA